MEIINKQHEDITTNQRVHLAAYFKVRDLKSIYFSAGAAKKFGLSGGLYVHFMNDGDRWYFYCNSESDGFQLITNSHKNSVLICDASLVNLFLKRTRTSLGCKFLIQLTPNKLKGSPVMEICLNKPIEDY